MWQLDKVSLPGLTRPRLNNVSLSIPSGITAIIGPSGAGKTSLLHLLSGFETSSTGTIIPRAGIKISWIPQDHGLWPHLNVAEHLHAVTTQDISPWLEKFDISDLAAAHPHTLSQGEKCRLALARALASKPDVLLADEPLVHVDPAREGIYWEFLCQAVKSLIYTTHEPEKVLGTAERVICLQGGEVLFNGSVDQLYYQPDTKQLAGFLGPCNWSERPALRPEQIRLQCHADGEWEVIRATFQGSMEQVRVRHSETQLEKIIYHRPSGGNLKTGNRVRIDTLV